MKAHRTVFLFALVVTFVASCGQGGDDSVACKGFIDITTPELGSLTDFSRNWESRRGSREGFEAAIKAGVAMEQISAAATEAAKVSSKKGKKLFEKLAETSKTAAYAIAVRGGSIDSYEAGLMVQLAEEFSSTSDFCSGEDSGDSGGG